MWSADGFSSFYEGLHGHACFPWQRRLAARVLAEGRWPELLSLPTGTGKTSCVEIALYTLAADPGRQPRRVVFVVDRRVVVDQAAEHSRRVVDRLGQARGGPVAEVAARLRGLWGGDAEAPPAAVTVLRGGMPRDEGWARRPDRPTVVLSTVDQVGSRLLFRGYGLSDRMLPIHAGLLGNDCLFLLDEVHLSNPFAETLRAVRERWRRLPAELPDRWGVVEMSATPRAGTAPFTLDAEDEANPVLRRRLGASKPARLVEVKLGGGDKAEAWAKRLADEAWTLREAGVVAVVVNRVDTARRVYESLSTRGEAVLLTGRMRPLDRDELLAEWLPRVRAGREREAGPPRFVVATQCIEAGADLDFDAMVTEVASLDALRQRFGRVDRRGERGRAEVVILASSEALKGEDPVYGDALAATWAWLLERREGLDVGVAAMPEAGEEAARLRAPATHAPVLLPAHLELWAQTSPRPWPDPVVAHWLHGPDRAEPEVRVVWRADLDPAALEGDAAPQAVLDALEVAPPSTLEALSVPISAARRWLRGEAAEALADVPQRDPEPTRRGRDLPQGRRALRFTGEGVEVVEASGLRPEDTLVVPCAYGGLRAGSWDPSAIEPVRDRGDEAQRLARGRLVLRLDPAVCAGSVGAPPPQPGEDEEPIPALLTWLGELPTRPAWLGSELRPRGWRLVRDDAGRMMALVGPRLRGVEVEGTTEGEDGSFTGREITLGRHAEDVRRWARAFAERLGLPDPLASDLALAAFQHDLGMADPRFQRWLAGGSEVRRALRDEPLAKSAAPREDAAARRRAQERAGYPQGYRHEVLSVAMVQAAGCPGAADRELVLHLVGSHHGWCRPFAPAVTDVGSVDVAVQLGGERYAANTDTRLAEVGSGVAERYHALNERYGWWGLAWLEALLRLADHRASADEEGSWTS